MENDMEKTITIADAHSQNEPTQSFKLPITGGSPWYGYLWIDDKMFTIYKDGETGKISMK